MAIYAVIGRGPIRAPLTVTIAQYPINYWVADNVVLVKAPPQATTRDVSQVLFPRDANGNTPFFHTVLVVGPWWGHYSTDLWEWLTINSKE